MWLLLFTVTREIVPLWYMRYRRDLPHLFTVSSIARKGSNNIQPEYVSSSLTPPAANDKWKSIIITRTPRGVKQHRQTDTDPPHA